MEEGEGTFTELCRQLGRSCKTGLKRAERYKLWGWEARVPSERPGLISLTGATCCRTNRWCRLVPAHEGMKCGSCGLVQRIGTADSARPHPDPSGGQAPALHFLIPPSTIGLQFGRIRRWRAGIEVAWRAHPGSESGMCFRTNRPCRLVPAHRGRKMRPGHWKCLGVVGATRPPPLDSRFRRPLHNHWC